jgi:DNA-binding GntR family transcriptional regulator
MSVLPVGPLSRDTLEHRVYTQIRDALMEGRFAPGQPITLRALAEALGVSPTPIRHALSRLVAEGAVSAGSKRTLTVPALTATAYEEISAMRQLLEGLAAERAAQRIDEAEIGELERLCDVMDAASEAKDLLGVLRANRAFHAGVHRAGGSAVLVAHLDSLWLRAGAVVPIAIQKSLDAPFIPKDPKHPHRRVVAALRARDGEAAKRALACDIAWATDLIVAHLAERPAAERAALAR